MDKGEKEGQRRSEGDRDGGRRRMDRGREEIDRQRGGEKMDSRREKVDG